MPNVDRIPREVSSAPALGSFEAKELGISSDWDAAEIRLRASTVTPTSPLAAIEQTLAPPQTVFSVAARVADPEHYEYVRVGPFPCACEKRQRKINSGQHTNATEDYFVFSLLPFAPSRVGSRRDTIWDHAIGTSVIEIPANAYPHVISTLNTVVDHVSVDDDGLCYFDVGFRDKVIVPSVRCAFVRLIYAPVERSPSLLPAPKKAQVEDPSIEDLTDLA